MEKLRLSDKSVQDKLEAIFFEIDVAIAEDDDIVNDLVNTLKDSNKNDKDNTLNYLKAKYSQSSFLQIFLKKIIEMQTPMDQKNEYKRALKTQSSQKILELMKQEQFWEENNMKKFIPHKPLMMKLQDQIIYLFDLIENSKNITYLPSYELLKRLLGFIYNKPDYLSHEENIILLSIIGSLLIKQIFELQYYLDSLIQQNTGYHQTFVNILQQQQIKAQNEQKIDKNFLEIYELFSQDLTDLKANLDHFLLNNLGLAQTELNFYQIIRKLEQPSIIKNKFQIIYFRVITYFWIQHCEQYQLIPQLKKTYEQNNKKHDQQVKIAIFQNFIKKYQTSDQIHTYVLQNFVYYSNQSKSYCQETYKQFVSSKDNNLKEFNDFKDSLLALMLKLSFEEFQQYWLVVQRNQANLYQGFFENAKLDDKLIQVLWKNQDSPKLFDALKEIMKHQITDLLMYALQLENKGFEQGILIDLLTIATAKNNLDPNTLYLFQNLLFTHISLKSIDRTILEQMVRCLYLYSQNEQNQFEQDCFEVYRQNETIYKTWLEPLNYLSHYQLRPQVLERKKYFSEYPRNINIQLESFNISLVQKTEEEQKVSVQNWVKSMNNQSSFLELMPFFFNIIKRGEASQLLTQLIYISLKQLGKEKNVLNMKALFQIFYNNCDSELKVMLLKLYSQSNPVPFIYQNLDVQSLKNEQDLFTLNHHLYYVFPESQTIINFTLSKTTGKIGKTELINNIFYRGTIFEVQDDCQLNKNTIDLMFDFSFNGSRNFAIADAHGIIPMSVLEKILPLFNFWIIQMDNESEIEENFIAIQDLQNQLLGKSFVICFLVRNSTSYQQQQYSKIIENVKNKKIKILFIPNLAAQNLNRQSYQQELDQASYFILDLIKCGCQSKLIGKNEFYQMQKSFTSNSQLVQSISKTNQIMTVLLEELERLSKGQDGFYSIKAFPLRHFENEIKEKKKEVANLQKQFGYTQKQQQNEILQQITELEQQSQEAELSPILNLFIQLFKENNYYILLIWFTEILQKFNKKINSILYDENSLINEEIAKLNKKQDQFQSIEQFKNQMDPLMEKLIKNLREQTFKTVGIELFWREIIKFSQLRCAQLSLNLIDIVYELIKKGEPFEFLDGDNLRINEIFLQELASKFRQDGGKRILTFSVLGPQSSGKSTILNKIFGCHFLTSVGRCTKGIYLQLIKVQEEKQFNGLIDYVLLLDTEGLQSPNRLDSEFDKQIVLLVLAVSDIILITVKGDITKEFKNLIEMGIYTLGQLKSHFSFIKTLSWCFNQNNDSENKQAFRLQIEDINNNLNLQQNTNETQEERVDFTEILNIQDENIHVLGFAQTEILWTANQNQGIFQEWKQLRTFDGFARDSNRCGIQTIKNFTNKLKDKNSHTMSNFNNIFANIKDIWDSIIILPDLLEFSELIQYKNNQLMKKEYEKSYRSQDTRFTQNIQQEIEVSVSQLTKKSIVLFRKISEDKEKEIIDRLKIIKRTVQEVILTTKANNKISKKITQKYLEQLDQQILHLQLECRLKILEEISNYEREFQEEQGFNSIFDHIQSLNKDQLDEYRNNPEQIKAQFELLWDKNMQEQLRQHENTLLEFQNNEFESMKSGFRDYLFISEKEKIYQDFFISHINKASSIQNVEKQKEDIYNLFSLEFTQTQFMVFDNSQKNQRYTQIFYLNYKQKQKVLKQSKNTNLINFNDWFEFQCQFFLISKKEISKYFLGQYKEDLLSFIQKKIQDLDEIHNYLGQLKLLNIQYNEQSLKDLISEISFSFKNSLSANEKSLKKACQKFCESIQFDENQSLRMKQMYSQQQLSQYFKKKLQISREQKFFRIKDEIKNYKKQIMADNVIVEISQKFQPQKNLSGLLLFKHIIDPQNTSEYSNEFKDKFAHVFNENMKKQGGWKKIYFQIYDIIQEEMKDRQNNTNDENYFDYGVVECTLTEIKRILEKIEQKIQDYNKQLATVGLIFTTVGERYIFYFSLFIIWRFICYKKWRNLQAHQEKITQLKQVEFEKFKLEIYQNKKELSIVKAKILVETLINAIKSQFLKANSDSVKQFIISKKQSSSEIIDFLDQELLQKQNRSQNDIIAYLQDQRQFIESYVDSLIYQIQIDLEKQYQEKFQKEMKFQLSIIHSNSQILQSLTIDNMKSKDYFNQEDLKKDEFYNNLLYQIILSCLQGEESIYFKAVLDIYKDIFFKKRYKSVKIFIDLTKDSQSNQQILILKAFIEEVSKQLESTILQLDQMTLNIKQFDVQSELDEIKFYMNGCQESCPICKRKCDSDIFGLSLLRKSHNTQHSCSNGHQLRGMNKVMINNQPSLFTCEEMENSDIIIIQETQVENTWEKIKQTYSEWNFKGFQDNLIKQNQSKMKNLWNGGIGKLMCQKISEELKKTIIFQPKPDSLRQSLQNQKIHYILVLDDSASMKGHRWEDSKKGALSSMEEINKNINAKVSVIIFNQTARVVIDCEKVQLNTQGSKFEFQNGSSTDFSSCFRNINEQIKKYENEDFHKIVILFYTDGQAPYPGGQINQMIQLSEKIKQSITFLICTDVQNPVILTQITQAFKPNFHSVQLKSSIQTNQIKETWSEIVQQNYHKLRL